MFKQGDIVQCIDVFLDSTNDCYEKHLNQIAEVIDVQHERLMLVKFKNYSKINMNKTRFKLAPCTLTPLWKVLNNAN